MDKLQLYDKALDQEASYEAKPNLTDKWPMI